MTLTATFEQNIALTKEVVFSPQVVQLMKQAFSSAFLIEAAPSRSSTSTIFVHTTLDCSLETCFMFHNSFK
jgi:hypothetical protein